MDSKIINLHTYKKHSNQKNHTKNPPFKLSATTYRILAVIANSQKIPVNTLIHRILYDYIKNYKI